MGVFLTTIEVIYISSRFPKSAGPRYRNPGGFEVAIICDEAASFLSGWHGFERNFISIEFQCLKKHKKNTIQNESQNKCQARTVNVQVSPEIIGSFILQSQNKETIYQPPGNSYRLVPIGRLRIEEVSRPAVFQVLFAVVDLGSLVGLA